MKDSPFYTEKYYHRYCVEGDTTNDSCGKHTGCHEAFAHNPTPCVNCNKEAYLEKLGQKGDLNRTTKDESLRLIRVNCGLEADIAPIEIIPI